MARARMIGILALAPVVVFGLLFVAFHFMNKRRELVAYAADSHSPKYASFTR